MVKRKFAITGSLLVGGRALPEAVDWAGDIAAPGHVMYDVPVSKIASDLEPIASAEQVRKARQGIKDLAVRLEPSDLRVADDGTLLLHVDRDPGYRPVIKFVNEAAQLLGAVPRVVVDSARGANRYQTTPL
ncbi:MAG: hypothetical protein ACYDH5_15705 [Acidimicrobiales bacterium]